MKLSAVIIAKDEAANIAECLKSVSFCDEAVVVDSGSADGTASIARACGAKVFLRLFDDFASQKNYAMGLASGDWLLLIDADERVSPDLAREIASVVNRPGADGYRLSRRNNLFGRWMKHGENRNDRPLRLVRRGKASFEGVVHETLRLRGTEFFLRGPLWHYSTPTVRSYMKKLEAYTTLEARRLKDLGARARRADLLLRPPAVFIRSFFFRSGWLDGGEGLIFCVLSAYYEFVRLAKLREIS